jgi:putative metallopeptidase DUF4344
MLSPRLCWIFCAILTVGAACKKKGESGEIPAGGKHKTVTAKPIAKKPVKPGAAANGKNEVIEPGDGAEKPKQEDRGHLKLAYKGEDSATRKLVRGTGVFEKMLPQLDQALLLPRDLEVVFDKCGEPNAFYDPETKKITMCDEYVDYYAEVFSQYPPDDRRDAIVGALVSTFLHELGHALIHQLDLPAVGRQEDAVDQLSTVVLIASGDEGDAMALDGADSFIAESEADGGDKTPFWDEHSLNEQRFYNIMCLIYGSDPDGFKEVITEDDLPDERAERCPEEYETISKSWTRLLTPYLTVAAVRMKLPAPK